MKKITTLLVLAIFMSSFMRTPIIANAAEGDKTAYELCKSANTWEEYKEVFENFQVDREDLLGRVLKELPERIEGLSTFVELIGYGGIKHEKADEFADAISYATSLYNSSEIGNLKLSVEKKDLESSYSVVEIHIEQNVLTHIGNVVKYVVILVEEHILLCTNDTILGWAELDGLYQYEDAKGNMEFYNPDFIRYK